MARPKIKLKPERQAELKKLLHKTNHGKDRERLQAAYLAAGGQHTTAQIADVLGRAKSAVQRWLEAWKKEDLAGLLRRGKAKGKPPALKPDDLDALRGKLREGQVRTIVQVQAWLREKRGVSLGYTGARYWMGKLPAVMRVPRPCHLKKNHAAVAEFRARLEEKLLAVPVEAGRRVKVWVTDEGRFGLHSFTRKVWTLRGVRPLAPSRQKYTWEYLYGALECSGGEAVFAHLPCATQEATLRFLEQIALSDPAAAHIVIQDGAGFHLPPSDPRLPEQVHLITLPAYSPELNPVEKFWDMLRDELCNRVPADIGALRELMRPTLEAFWSLPSKVLSLVGRNWLSHSVNDTFRGFIPASS